MWCDVRNGLWLCTSYSYSLSLSLSLFAIVIAFGDGERKSFHCHPFCWQGSCINKLSFCIFHENWKPLSLSFFSPRRTIETDGDYCSPFIVTRKETTYVSRHIPFYILRLVQLYRLVLAISEIILSSRRWCIVVKGCCILGEKIIIYGREGEERKYHLWRMEFLNGDLVWYLESRRMWKQVKEKKNTRFMWTSGSEKVLW